MKYLTGSKMLGLTNNKDTDYICFVDIDGNENTEDKTIDYIKTTMDRLQKTLHFERTGGDSIYRNQIYNYQYDEFFMGKDFPINYHILDYREEYIRLLKDIVKNEDFNFTKSAIFNNGICSKIIYHIAYGVFILENNSPEITPEQKAIVQKIHDRQMPIAYLDVLEEKIRNLQ